MTMPTSQCPWRMQVHHIHQETPDVWTLSLLCHDYYPYRAGQYALVSVRNSAETLRAYTLSSTPGVSEYITLTVRRIDERYGFAVVDPRGQTRRLPLAVRCDGRVYLRR